ncbi:MAG: hypothetical protein AAFZ07_04215 [Actinomycetota bacterium]
MPEALPYITNAPNITRAELIREIQTGSRLVSFPHVVSFGVTVDDPGPAWLVRPGESTRKPYPEMVTSAVFGWWGISGIGSTLRALQVNRAGGHDETELFFGTYATAAILRHGRPRSPDEPIDEAALDEEIPDGHLPASGPKRRRTRSVVLAALVAVVVPALVALAVLSSSPGRRVDELDVGDCFDLPDGDTVERVDLRSCDEPHDAQLFALDELDDDTIAADLETLEARALARCRERAREVGIGDDVLAEGADLGVFLQERGPDDLRRIARCYVVSDLGLRSSLLAP